MYEYRLKHKFEKKKKTIALNMILCQRHLLGATSEMQENHFWYLLLRMHLPFMDHGLQLIKFKYLIQYRIPLIQYRTMTYFVEDLMILMETEQTYFVHRIINFSN